MKGHFNLKFIFILSFLICSTLCQHFNDFEMNNKKILNIYGPFTKENYEEINSTLNGLKSYLKILQKSHNDGFLQYSNHTDGLLCKSCMLLFGTIHDILMNTYGLTLIFEVISIVCSIFLDWKVCHGSIDLFGPIVASSLFDHYLSKEYLCTLIYACENAHFITLNADDYAREVLKDKPIYSSLPNIDNSSPTWRVLHLTDIHTDLEYQEGSRGLCPSEICCRNEKNRKNVKSFSSDQTAGKWGFVGKCDLPLNTLMNFLDTIFNDIKPDFIIFTGDNPSHDPWDGSEDESWNVTKLFTNLIINKYNYSLPIYPCLGNHEKYPADQFDPYQQSTESGFLKKFGDLWRVWLGEEAYQTFINTGSYTKIHPNSNLRIISMNCMLCDALNFHLIKNPTDPYSGIKWLENTLKIAEKNNEIVYLVSHIPQGDVSFLSECGKRLKALLDRYSFIIRGNFYGHTHFDEFKLMHEYFNTTKVSGIAWIAPSLTT